MRKTWSLLAAVNLITVTLIVVLLATTCLAASGRVLRAFTIGSGGEPSSPLTLDAAGNLYGTTAAYGPNGGGTVFMLSPSLSGPWKLTLLHNFGAVKDGSYPRGGVSFDSAGNLYGTTYYGGAYGYGTVYELMPTAQGKWSYKTIHEFTNRAGDGSYTKSTPTIDNAGNLYGTASSPAFQSGFVFELSPQPDGSWQYRIIYAFQGENDPDGVQNVVFGPDGGLYGAGEGLGRTILVRSSS